MQKRAPSKQVRTKASVSGSITIGEHIKKKAPWILGSLVKKPKIKYPEWRGRKLSVPMPAKTLGLIGIYIILFILQTGVVYLIYKEPPALGAKPNGDAIFLYPSIQDSFIIEGIVASILIFIASLGYLLLYQASKYLYNRTMAIRILIIGLFMIFATFAALQFMIAVKAGNINPDNVFG
ncbi:MAG: hypothetical protein ACTSR8_01805 [Promethearchaeota archaeon]